MLLTGNKKYYVKIYIFKISLWNFTVICISSLQLDLKKPTTAAVTSTLLCEKKST